LKAENEVTRDDSENDDPEENKENMYGQKNNRCLSCLLLKPGIGLGMGGKWDPESFFFSVSYD
jgi:hypothetical protein